MKKWIIPTIVVIALLFIMFNLYQSTPYYNDLNKEEKKIIDNTAQLITADNEIEELESLKSWVYKKYNNERPIDYNQKELNFLPSELLKRDYGLCFERSYIFELLAQSKGYKVRHVVITEDEGSHAISEVLVNNKWIMFDTQNNITAKDESGKYLSTLEILEQNKDIDYFKHDYNSILYGVNSFHGRFFNPKIPYPDVKVNQLVYNIPVLDKLPYIFLFQKIKVFLAILLLIIIIFVIYKKVK